MLKGDICFLFIYYQRNRLSRKDVLFSPFPFNKALHPQLWGKPSVETFASTSVDFADSQKSLPNSDTANPHLWTTCRPDTTGRNRGTWIKCQSVSSKFQPACRSGLVLPSALANQIAP